MARLRPNAPMPNNWLRISSVKPITLTSNNCNLSATTVVNMKAHVHSELTEPKKRFAWHSQHYANATRIVFIGFALRSTGFAVKALNSMPFSEPFGKLLLAHSLEPCQYRAESKIYHADLAIKHQWFIGGGDDTLRGHEHLDHGDVRGQ